MSVDPDLLTISQIAARLPGSRGARRVHPATVIRWIVVGCPNRNGQRVKLTATRAGSRWLVRAADLDAFFVALAADSTPPSSPAPTPRTAAAQQRGHVVGRGDVAPAARGRQRRIAVAGGDVQHLLAGAHVKGFAKLFSYDLQRGADDGVVPGRPGALLAGFQGGQIMLCGVAHVSGGKGGNGHGVSPIERGMRDGLHDQRAGAVQPAPRRLSRAVRPGNHDRNRAWRRAW